MKKFLLAMSVCGFFWTCNQPIDKPRSQPQSDEYPDSVGPVSPELKTTKKIDSIR
jgi:hypothetical protein